MAVSQTPRVSPAPTRLSLSEIRRLLSSTTKSRQRGRLLAGIRTFGLLLAVALAGAVVIGLLLVAGFAVLDGVAFEPLLEALSSAGIIG